MADDKGLSLPKLSSIIFLIATGKDQVAADMAGVTLGTLKGWQSDPEYKAEYARRAGQLLGLIQIIKINKQLISDLYNELFRRLQDPAFLRAQETKTIISMIKSFSTENRQSQALLRGLPVGAPGTGVNEEEDPDKDDEQVIADRFKQAQGRR